MYNLFIWRWQPLHKWHQEIINTYLKKWEKVCIAIRDIEWEFISPEDNKWLIEWLYEKECYEWQIKVIIIPNIKSINYGRNVGYEVKKIEWTNKDISWTNIRESILKEDDNYWLENTDKRIHDNLFFLNYN